MIIVACPHCFTALRVEGSDDEESDTLIGKSSSFFPDGYRCPIDDCGKKSSMFYPSELSDKAMGSLTFVDVTPNEAFVALNGMGLPAERSCLLEDVQDLLQKGIKKVSGKNIPGTSRCVVDFIETADGSKIYLAASSHGATVFRTTRIQSHADKVEGDHVG